jgi:exosortase/archaeosortase family protein
MEQVISNRFTYLQQNKRQLLLLSFIFLLVCFGVICWQLLIQTSIYQYSIACFAKVTGRLTVLISNLLGQYPIFEPLTYHLSFNGKFHSLIMPTASYRFYFIGFLLLFVVPIKDYKYSLLLIVSSLAFIALRASAITIIQVIYPQDIILLLWIDPLIYIPMFAIILFVSNRNQIIKPLFDKVCSQFKPLLNVSLPILILLLLLVTPIPRVILNYLALNAIDELTTMTLKISKIVLGWFSYETVITTRFIFLGKFWLRLEQPCLGIGVVTLVWILVGCIKSKWLNKLIFLIFFSLLFVVMNSIRLSVLLIIIKKTYLTGLNKMELHDNITYVMYLFAFVSFLIYYFWFQDIKWRKNN